MYALVTGGSSFTPVVWTVTRLLGAEASGARRVCRLGTAPGAHRPKGAQEAGGREVGTRGLVGWRQAYALSQVCYLDP